MKALISILALLSALILAGCPKVDEDANNDRVNDDVVHESQVKLKTGSAAPAGGGGSSSPQSGGGQ